MPARNGASGEVANWDHRIPNSAARCRFLRCPDETPKVRDVEFFRCFLLPRWLQVPVR
jgi:hypothetical protein